MDKKRGIKSCFLAAAIALLAVAAAVPAGAGNSNVNCHKQDLNRLLTGDYYGSASFVCAGSTWGFNETDLGRKPLVIPPNINYPMDVTTLAVRVRASPPMMATEDIPIRGGSFHNLRNCRKCGPGKIPS